MKINESIDAYVSFAMQYKTIFRQLLEIHISGSDTDLQLVQRNGVSFQMASSNAQKFP